jgi:ferredoxin
LDIEERRIGDLTIKIDRLLCVGFETCIEEDSNLFDLDDEGIAVFHAEAETVAAERILSACRVCPVDALEVIDASGERIVP